MSEIGGAVERIDAPAQPILFALGPAFLSQDGDFRGVFPQSLQNTRFCCEICIGDQVPDAALVLDA